MGRAGMAEVLFQMSAMRNFSPFANETWQMLAFLSLGLDGKASVKITASKHGLTLHVGKIMMARGKDARALVQDYERRAAEARAMLERLK
jgi:hypothetical protein